MTSPTTASENTAAVLQKTTLSFRALMGIFVFALFFRVLYIWFAVDNSSMGGWYDSGANIALNMMEGRGYVASWEVCRDFQSFRTPVLPLVLYAVWSVLGFKIVAAKLVMALFSAATCVLLSLIATRLFDARVGLAAGIATAICTSLIRWTGTLGADTLAVFFLVAGVYYFCCPSPRFSSGARFFLSGLMFGLLCLTRPLWLPYVAIIIVSYAMSKSRGRRERGRRERGRSKNAFILCAALSLVMLPWMVRNALVHRTVVIASTEGGIAFLEANNPISYAGKGDWAVHFAVNQPDVQRASRVLPEAAFDRFMLRKGLGYAAADPFNFGRVYLIKLGYLWRPVPPPQHAGDLSGKHLAWMTLWWSTFTALMLVALAALRPWRTPEQKAILWVLVWGSLILPLFSSQLRYRAPLEPFILLLGSAGWFAILDGWKRRTSLKSATQHRVLDVAK